MTLTDLYRDYKTTPSDAALQPLLNEIQLFALAHHLDRDSSQDVLVAFIENLEQLPAELDFDVWLTEVVEKRYWSQARESIAHRKHTDANDWNTQPAQESPQITYTFAASGVDRALCECILSGATLEQAAKASGISFDAARKRMFRLRRKINMK